MNQNQEERQQPNSSNIDPCQQTLNSKTLKSTQQLDLDSVLDENEFSLLQQIKQKTYHKSQNSINLSFRNDKSLNCSKQISASSIQKLYEDNFSKIQKIQSILSIQDQELQAQINKTKYNYQTYKILLDNIEKNIDQVQKTVLGEDEKMTFSQLGLCLMKLEIFRILKFDDQNNFISSELVDTTSQNQSRNQRKFQEMTFHELFWRILCGNQKIQQVDVKLFNQIMKTLLKPAFKDNNCPKSQQLYVILSQFKQEVFYDLQTVNDFIQLFQDLQGDRLSYKQIGNLTQKKFMEYVTQNQNIHTHQPKLDVNSLKLQQKNIQKFLQQVQAQKQEGEEGENQDTQINDKEINQEQQPIQNAETYQQDMSQVDRIDILLKKKEIVDEKIKRQRVEKIYQELKECSFKPDLQINQNINEWAVSSKYQDTNIFKRLYKFDTLKQKSEKEKFLNDEKCLNDLEKCTFNPQINMSRPSTIKDKLKGENLVDGYAKAVNRMQNGFSQRSKAEYQLYHIPVGENYERNRNSNFKPPAFLEREKIKKRQPYFLIDANIGPGKTGRIVLHEGDDPLSVTENFARAFQISQEMKVELFEMLKKQVDKHEQELEKKFNKQQLKKNKQDQRQQLSQQQYQQYQADYEEQQQQQQQLKESMSDGQQQEQAQINQQKLDNE